MSLKRLITWLLLIWGVCMLLGISIVIYNSITGIRYMNFVSSHKPKDIYKIEFYSLANNSSVDALIKTIEDYQTIEKMSGFLSEAVGYLPNHPNYIRESYAVFYVNNGSKFELVFQLMEEPNETVYIEFVGKKGNLTSYYGNAMVENKSFLPFLESLGVLK